MLRRSLCLFIGSFLICSGWVVAKGAVLDLYSISQLENDYTTSYTNGQLEWGHHALLWKSFAYPGIQYNPVHAEPPVGFAECPSSNLLLNENEADSCVFASDPPGGWTCGTVGQVDVAALAIALMIEFFDTPVYLNMEIFDPPSGVFIDSPGVVGVKQIGFTINSGRGNTLLEVCGWDDPAFEPDDFIQDASECASNLLPGEVNLSQARADYYPARCLLIGCPISPDLVRDKTISSVEFAEWFDGWTQNWVGDVSTLVADPPESQTFSVRDILQAARTMEGKIGLDLGDGRWTPAKDYTEIWRKGRKPTSIPGSFEMKRNHLKPKAANSCNSTF